MRCLVLLATIYAATLGTSAALVDAGEKTTVDVSASGYDKRTSGNGCSPDGCIPENTRDGSLSSNSRWSCKGDILGEKKSKGCWIKYWFDEPQDIVDIKIAFYKGKEDTRTLKVYNNGKYLKKIKSSGKTDKFQTFSLDTDETAQLKLYLDDYKSNSDVWFSLTEVELMVKK